jgi:hypothetical protein
MLERQLHIFSMRLIHVDYLRLLSVSVDIDWKCVVFFCWYLEKLGLIFPKCRSKRKYGCVGFDYGTIVDQYDDEDEEEEDVNEMDLRTGQGHEILSEQDKTTIDKLNKQNVNIIFIYLNLTIIKLSVFCRKMLNVKKMKYQYHLKINDSMRKKMNLKNGIDMKHNMMMLQNKIEHHHIFLNIKLN